MARMLFPNLPVRDLERTVRFWKDLGFTFNEQFSDDKAACLVINDQASIMLLSEPFFSTFTSKSVADALTTAEVILALALDSRDEVDQVVDRALAGGAAPSGETQDDGMMFTRSFQDPDGHLWEIFHMDTAALDGSEPTAGARV